MIAVALAEKPWTPSAHPGTTAASRSEGRSFTNRLIIERSLYLIQHAHNPVDWYSWGEEAFAKARKEKTPMFLSVGYSTCHWCHVMEHESFENPQLAQFLRDVKMHDGKATAFVCEDYVCQLPTTEVAVLLRLIAPTPEFRWARRGPPRPRRFVATGRAAKGTPRALRRHGTSAGLEVPTRHDD